MSRGLGRSQDALCRSFRQPHLPRMLQRVLSRGSRVRAIAVLGTTTLMVVGLGALSAFSAIAEELSGWRYDSQTRSLSLSLPNDVTPNISVIAPNKMLVEMSNTQMGDVTGQQVGDGWVENIVLEQASPETLWMFVAFVPGTVLASSQSAIPLAASGENAQSSAAVAQGASLQQWQISPALVASRPGSSSALADASLANSSLNDSENDSEEASAAALRTEQFPLPPLGSGVAIAQSLDFPDLPVLKPAMPISEPISVPPLDIRSVQSLPVESVPVESVLLESVQSENAAPIDIPVVREPISAEVEPPIAEIPVSVPPEVEPPIAEIPVLDEATSPVADVPRSEAVEPPFIGNIDIPVFNLPDLDEPTASVPSVTLPDIEADAALEAVEEDASNAIAQPPLESAEAIDQPVLIPDTATAAIPMVDSGFNTDLADLATPESNISVPNISVPESSVSENPVIARPADARTETTSRWPDPIPFGQPLP